MEPQYHQLELDLRIFCVVVAMGKNPYSWTVSGQRSAKWSDPDKVDTGF